MLQFILNTYPNIAGFSLVVGFLLLAHSHNRKNYIKNILKNGTKTEGRVIEIYRNPGSMFSKESGEGFAPVVEYTTISGNILKHYSTTFRTNAKYQVGQIVPLWYVNYKSNREAALEDDEPGNLPKKLFVTGVIFLLVGLPKLCLSFGMLF